MRSTTIFASVLAFAASALAQDATAGYAVVSAPGNGEIVPAGKTYTIQWSAGKFSGPATISLMGGNDPTTLVVLEPIATTVDVEDESFSWKVACSLGKDKTYGLKIADTASGGATFQYSFPFEIKGPSCDSESSSSVSASATSSASITASITASATATATGYPTKETSSTTSTTETSSYVVATSTSYSYSHSNSTSITTSLKPTTSAHSTKTTLATLTTPVVIVTETSSVTESTGTSTSGFSATTSSTSTSVPTAGAARVGAGLALGFFAAALAL